MGSLLRQGLNTPRTNAGCAQGREQAFIRGRLRPVTKARKQKRNGVRRQQTARATANFSPQFVTKNADRKVTRRHYKRTSCHRFCQSVCLILLHFSHARKQTNDDDRETQGAVPRVDESGRRSRADLALSTSRVERQNRAHAAVRKKRTSRSRFPSAAA